VNSCKTGSEVCGVTLSLSLSCLAARFSGWEARLHERREEEEDEAYGTQPARRHPGRLLAAGEGWCWLPP